MNLIVAVDENWNIGNKGDLLERISADMKHFKNKTINNTIIMGRVTFESLPNSKPLPNRKHIVLTRNKNLSINDVVIKNSTEELFEEINNNPDENYFLIGGGKIYNLLYPYCKKAYITKIYNKYEADTSFPNFDEMENWNISEKDEIMENKNGVKFQFITYENSSPKEM